jgi:hypothetical protein
MPYKDYEKHKENARLNYYKHKELRLKQVKAYYLANWGKKQEQRKVWRKANPDKVAGYTKKYAQSNKGKTAMERAIAKQKLTPDYEQKISARGAVHNARRRGELLRPANCQNCLSKKILQAHHYKGYDKKHWLVIEWLCNKCHKEAHNNAKYHNSIAGP